MKKFLTSSLVLCFVVLGLCGCSQSAPPVYTITYHLNGGSADTVNPTAFNEATPTFVISNPTRDGYAFEGWSSSEDLQSPILNVEVSTGSTGSRSYYAVWRLLPSLVVHSVDSSSLLVTVVVSTVDWNKNATVIIKPVVGQISGLFWQNNEGIEVLPQSCIWDGIEGHFVAQFFMTRDLELTVSPVMGGVEW